jgi:hypothetical protein
VLVTFRAASFGASICASSVVSSHRHIGHYGLVSLMVPFRFAERWLRTVASGGLLAVTVFG